MSPDSARETCFTCNKKPIIFHKISDYDGDSKLNIHEIICQHFWFKEDDLRSAIVCESCWEKMNQFHQFYLDVEKLHEHRQVAALSMFIKQEEITIEETQLQENCMDISEENQKIFDIADCKHEMPKACDELSKKEELAEVPCIQRKTKYTQRLANKRVVKRKKPHSRKPLTLEERQAEDDFIKQHTRYICDECNTEYENFRAIKFHRMKAHSKNTFMCCGNHYRIRSILYQHVQSFLNPEAFRCEICGKSFKFKNSYVHHKELFHAAKDELLFKCKRCSKSFTTEGLLESHLAEHETLGNEMVKCEFCSKSFPYKYLLNKHVKAAHKKTMDFLCEVCSKGFYQRAIFLAHQKTHELTAEQLKEQCPICSKWLKNHKIMLEHMRRHKKGKCKCEECGHLSSNMLYLKKHMKRIHEPTNKRHLCVQCGKEYSRSTYLKEHVANAHTREHLYQCEHCEMKFFSSSSMYSHRKKDHPQEWLLSKNVRNEEISVCGETLS